MVWSGEWVAERLDVRVTGEGLRDLVGLAVRRNPKRAHLLVSQVLGKHVPQSPKRVYGAGLTLGQRVRALLGEAESEHAVVLGYAETATGLGHSVADGIGGATYLHSTRRPVRGTASVGGFEEEHSHATSHLLLPEDPRLFAGEGPLVLVDDEFSTGRTARNTIAALHSRYPRERYVIVALIDMRSADDVAQLEKFAAGLGAHVDVIALARGGVTLPDDVLERGRRLVAQVEAEAQREAEAEREAGAAMGPDPSSDPSSPGPRVPGQGRTRGQGQGQGHGQAPEGDASSVTRVGIGWPPGLPDGGRHGFTPAHRARLDAALPAMAERLAVALGETLTPGPERVPRVLVLGCEELMYAPLRLAAALEERLGERAEVRFSTTTRSPVLPVDDPAYAIRTRLSFPAHDTPEDGGPGSAKAAAAAAPATAPASEALTTTDTATATDTGTLVDTATDTATLIDTAADTAADTATATGPGPDVRYAYNVASGKDAGRRFDAVVVVTDSCADTPRLHAPDGLLAEVAPHTDGVLLAVLPSYVPLERPLRGPDFSSYAPGEVGWLLQDFSHVRLEAPTEEREEAIQSGGAHYAESLPVEYQPSADYQRLFHSALDASAARIARAVGTVTETVLAERAASARPFGPASAGVSTGASGPAAVRNSVPVLVSLARAGTPVGVLMRRWAQRAHGLDLPHYAISIVRGRGIDTAALRWLAAHHDPADVVFVDGWTGKGAITTELADALAPFPGFSPELAVLADPGGCVRTYGTREDFLIPSACLNSTVSGLISRTVLRSDLVGPGDFHGAKFYRELADSDLSGLFLDAVTARFDEVSAEVADGVRELLAADRTPTWAGRRAMERISEEYGIGDVNLVKPGVGETTRVLLRRVPWKVLARPGVGADLDHVRLLAEQRGVPVEEAEGLPYSCVGLIHPRFTRGATGADGKRTAL